MKKIIISLSLLSIFALAIVGCEDYNELTAPELNLGTANFTRFVSIGNSITAGLQSGSLFESGQIYSFGNLISKQVGAGYQVPYVSDPGTIGRIEIQSLSPFTTTINTQQGNPLNSAYPAPYNNLGIPYSFVYDVLYATNKDNCILGLNGRPIPFFDLILRNSFLNLGSQFQQAKLLNPTFMTLWIGNNDVLIYAGSGGVTPSSPTPPQIFGALYSQLADSIASLVSQVIVANIPNVSAIPYFTTVGPQMAFSIPWGLLAAAGAPGLFYQKHGETINPASYIDSVGLLTGQISIILPGGSYASLLGLPTGKYYADNSLPLPAGIDTTKHFGFHPQNPWPDGLTLDADEITTANSSVSQYNSTIQTIATAKGWGLVDINTTFNQIRSNDFTGGTNYNGVNFKTTYVSGGLFSLDGVHPTSQAHGIIANEFIKVINSRFNAAIPLIDVSTIPGSLPMAGQYSLGKKGYLHLPVETFKYIYF